MKRRTVLLNIRNVCLIIIRMLFKRTFPPQSEAAVLESCEDISREVSRFGY